MLLFRLGGGSSVLFVEDAENMESESMMNDGPVVFADKFDTNS